MVESANLEDCVLAVFCPLGRAVINAFNNILAAQVVLLQTEVTALTALIVSLQIQLVPLQIAKAAAEAALAASQQIVNLVPAGIVAGCIDAGFSLQAINAALDGARADAKAVLDDANRCISATEFFEAKRDELNAAIDMINNLRQTLKGCP